MPPYRQWDEEDKQAMLDDIWRMVSQGTKVDGTKPSHVEDGSIGKLREIQNLHVYGDGIDRNLSNDTHGTWSVMRLHERVSDLVKRLEQAGVIPQQPEV